VALGTQQQCRRTDVRWNPLPIAEVEALPTSPTGQRQACAHGARTACSPAAARDGGGTRPCVARVPRSASTTVGVCGRQEIARVTLPRAPCGRPHGTRFSGRITSTCGMWLGDPDPHRYATTSDAVIRELARSRTLLVGCRGKEETNWERECASIICIGLDTEVSTFMLAERAACSPIPQRGRGRSGRPVLFRRSRRTQTPKKDSPAYERNAGGIVRTRGACLGY